MHGGDDGSSLLHALKDRPRTTHAHTLAHMEAGLITQNVEGTGRLHTKSQQQIQDERKKLMYTRRPVIETLALVSYELQMFQRQFAPRPEGIHKLRSKSKSANHIWGVDLHKLRDVRRPKQKILGLKISKDDVPSLKMADTSDSDSDFSGDEDELAQKATRFANQGMSSGSQSGTTPHTAHSSMYASGAASHSNSRAASRPLSPIGETNRKVHHKHRKAPKWQKAVQKKNASVEFEAQPSEVETTTEPETKTQEEEAISAIEEDPGQAATNYFPAPWSTNWSPELGDSELPPPPLGWEALPRRRPAAGSNVNPTGEQHFSNRDFHHLFTRTKARAAAPKAVHHAPEEPIQEGVQIGSAFVFGAADPDQQAAHLEKQGRLQQERLMQESCELDRLRIQQQEILIQQQQEQEQQALSQTEAERSLTISSSKKKPQRGLSAKSSGERPLELEAWPSRSGRDPRRSQSQFGEAARDQQLQQMSPGHGLARRPSLSTPPGAPAQNLTSRPSWPSMPDDASLEDIKLPSSLTGVSAISRSERSVKKNSRSMLHFKSSKGSRFSEQGGAAETEGQPASTDSTTLRRNTTGGGGSNGGDQGSDGAPGSPQNSDFEGADNGDNSGRELFENEGDKPPAISMPWPARRPMSPPEQDSVSMPAQSEHPSHSPSKATGAPNACTAPAFSLEQGRPGYPTATATSAGRDTPESPPHALRLEGVVGSSSWIAKASVGGVPSGSQPSSSAGATVSTGGDATKDASKVGGVLQQAQKGRSRGASAAGSALCPPDTAGPVGQVTSEQPLQQRHTNESPLQQEGRAAPGNDANEPGEFMSQLSNNLSSGKGTDDGARQAAAEKEGRDQAKQPLKRPSKLSDGSAADPTLAGTRTAQRGPQTSWGGGETPPGAAALKPSSPSGVAKSNAWINHEDIPGRKNGDASSALPSPNQLPDTAATQAEGSSEPPPSFSLPPQLLSSADSSPRGQARSRQAQAPATAQQEPCAVVAKILSSSEAARPGGDSVAAVTATAADQSSSVTKLKPISRARMAAAAAASAAAAKSQPHAEPGVIDEAMNDEVTGSEVSPQASSPQSPRQAKALNRKASPPRTHGSASATMHGTTKRAGDKEKWPKEYSKASTASSEGTSAPPSWSSAYPPGYNWTMAEASAIIQSHRAVTSRGSHLTQTTLMKPREKDSQTKGGLELVEQLASIHHQLANRKGTAAPASTPTAMLSASSSPNISPPRPATSASSPSAFLGSTRAPLSGAFSQHHLHHHHASPQPGPSMPHHVRHPAFPQQQAHSDNQRLLHHDVPASARASPESTASLPASRPASLPASLQRVLSREHSPGRGKEPLSSPTSLPASLPVSRPALSPLGPINTPSKMSGVSYPATTAPAPSSRSSTPLTPTPLSRSSPLTSHVTRARTLPGQTQQDGDNDQPASIQDLLLPEDHAQQDSHLAKGRVQSLHLTKAKEAEHTAASNSPSPLRPQDSVLWPATPPSAAKRGPLSLTSLAPPLSSHVPLPVPSPDSTETNPPDRGFPIQPLSAAAPARPHSSHTLLPAPLPASTATSSDAADRACSSGGARRTWDLSQLPRGGSQTMFMEEKGATPYPWTPPRAPRLHPPSPSLSSTGTLRSPLSPLPSKNPLPNDTLDAIWEGVPHTLKESSLILSLLRSVRGALPPNSIPTQHCPRPRTSKCSSNAPASTLQSSPDNLRKLATPSTNGAPGTLAMPSDAPSTSQHRSAGMGANHPSPLSVAPDLLLPAASPLQHHQPLPMPPLFWPANLPPSHLPPPHSPAFGVSSPEKPARVVVEHTPSSLHRKPLLARSPSTMNQHPKSRVALYDATHLVGLPPLSSVDPLDLGDGCPPEVQELLLQKLGNWLPYTGAAAGGLGSLRMKRQMAEEDAMGICSAEAGNGECQRGGDGWDVREEEQQCVQCRGRQKTMAHGPWPADHSRCAGPLCRAAQAGKAQWWAPRNDDWPFAQGGAASGADRAGLRHQLISSFTQFG